MVETNPVLRVVVITSALIAVLVVGGAGTGVANADPDDPGNVTEPDPTGGTTAPSEPGPPTAPPAATPPGIFDIPQTIANQLRDMFGRPLSMFGNGRVPGTLTIPATPTPSGTTTGRGQRDKPAARDEPKVAPARSVPIAPVQQSTVDAPTTVPVPPAPVPGYENSRWALNLTDPYAAFASVRQTLTAFNALLSDAFGPRDPVTPPAPEPEPTFRILQEEPTVVDADPTDVVTPLAGGSSELPVLQAPVVVPHVRFAPPPPITGSIPGRAPEPAGVAAAQPRGPVTQTGAQPGAAPTGQAPASGANAGTGGPAPREGYPGYLRSARITQVATVALPGLGGLIAITVSGGLIGYRQANSGRCLRSDAARFLQ